MVSPKKSLGQHWLKDRQILSDISDSADISSSDTVLEIGPGLGTLTSELLRRADRVVAVEIDEQLASKLSGQFPGKNLEIVCGDILRFDLSKLSKGYIVVANVPYYITSKIVRYLMESSNRPKRVALLVQREVAQRIAAGPGRASLLSIGTQIYAKTSLGVVVEAEYFTPPPKVDSQVVVLDVYDTPLVPPADISKFFRLVHIGFSAPRKKLKSNLAHGLALSKDYVAEVMAKSHINIDARAQDLSIEQWQKLLTLVQ